MNKEEYKEEIYSDACDWISDRYMDYDDFQELYEDMAYDITGNSNGSYYCNMVLAEEAVLGVIFDEDINDECSRWGFHGLPIKKGPEFCDVVVRIIILHDMYYRVKKVFDDLKENDG